MLFVALVIVLVFVGAILFLGVSEIAFARIGFSSQEFFGILILTLVGSMINIPVRRYTNVEGTMVHQEVRFYWRTFRIPQFVQKQVSTLVTINMGGAVVPILVSLYLLAIHPSIIIYALIATLFTSVVIHLVAKKVRGVGIVTPAFIPPLAAATISLLISQGTDVAIIAYTAGTLGALIGADLTNLRGITKLGAPVVSIGGAGTFDGVFLTGIIAVLLVTLL
ncbi:MAG: DUF1614 domain-containing protein [Nitrososphaerales archaeon]